MRANPPVKGMIRGIGIVLLIASIIALLLLYHCLSKINKGVVQNRESLFGNRGTELREDRYQGVGNPKRSYFRYFPKEAKLKRIAFSL